MSKKWQDEFSIKETLETKAGKVSIYNLKKLAEKFPNVNKLPYSIKILLEAVVRQNDGFIIENSDVEKLANWSAKNKSNNEIPFKPARVIMQDFTGVPGVVDLAAMRNTLKELGGDPKKINPVLPVDLVIDHSVQIDKAGSDDAIEVNRRIEFERNQERYEFLKWGADTFDNFQVVPPSTGIVHQVNLEFLAKVVQTREVDGELFAFPDSLVGTDSHTTMINGLGVVGWGVGGIEAEAVMLEQPVYMLTPEVVGFKLSGKLPEGATATDLVLTIVEQLRAFGVVGKFVEFFGPGVKNLSLADRATIANMGPEYGATMGFFPVDQEAINYLKLTSRDDGLIDLVEKYTKAVGLFADDNSEDAEYSDVLELDMCNIEPSISGPKRPQDRILLKDSAKSFYNSMNDLFKIKPSAPFKELNSPSEKGEGHYNDKKIKVTLDGKEAEITHGSIVIASITSCTNTSNPSVIIAAGLLAKKAAAKGLTVPAHVKTSLAPGSVVVTSYLKNADLLVELEKLGFNVIGYGCATCIGNSGPIHSELSKAIQDNDLVATSVLSGNRNFEGRIHQDVRGNYLASPPLVVAYAIAGTMDFDLNNEPLGKDSNGNNVYLKDIWPSTDEIKQTVAKAVSASQFQEGYSNVYKANKMWNDIESSSSEIYNWKEESTYIRRPTFFDGMTLEVPSLKPIKDMSVLALLSDSVTTDHISPAGAIQADSPAGRWLTERKVEPKNFNTYGSRRGNHEVMIRGTFANIRIRNQLVPGVEGGVTRHIPSGKQMAIADASEKYMADNTPLIVIAGKEYGTGSSRDWAAKGTVLLGVKVVIAESFERIHRSNLIGMGVLPLQFNNGENAASLKLTGEETFSINDLSNDLKPMQQMKVTVKRTDNSELEFMATVRVDTPVEVEYLKNGGILHTVLRKLGSEK